MVHFTVMVSDTPFKFKRQDLDQRDLATSMESVCNLESTASQEFTNSQKSSSASEVDENHVKVRKLVLKGMIPEQYTEWTRWVIDKTVHNYTKDLNHEYYKKKARQDDKAKSFFDKTLKSKTDKESDDEPESEESENTIKQSEIDDPLVSDAGSNHKRKSVSVPPKSVRGASLQRKADKVNKELDFEDLDVPRERASSSNPSRRASSNGS